MARPLQLLLLPLVLAVAAALQYVNVPDVDSVAIQLQVVAGSLSQDAAAEDCADNNDAARVTAGTILSNITGCADLAPLCRDPGAGRAVSSLCCDTCRRGCRDDDAAAREQASNVGLRIGGCGDVGYLCEDQAAGAVIRSICCATCSAPPKCSDMDAMVAAQAAASGVSITGCSQVAHLCGDELAGHMVSSLCCATCASWRAGESPKGPALSAPAPAPPSARATGSGGGSCGVKGADDTPWQRAASRASKGGGRIVNGQDASRCEWKWQACIMEASHPAHSGQCWCGGTLVAERWVLTAAHCVETEGRAEQASNITVTLGEYKHFKVSDGTEVVHKVSRIIVHEAYHDATTDNDIALLELEEPAIMGDCVGTACLPAEDVAPGSTCYVTGWGERQWSAQAQTLQEAEVTTLTNQACRDKYGPGNITDAMLCATGDTEGLALVDACQGDSGGPLVCASKGAWTVEGVVSWGRGCAEPGYPGVYARVHAFKEWISATTGADATGSLGEGRSLNNVHATGDPHMVNVHGQHFDLMQAGRHILIQMPRGATARDSMLLVSADASRVGLACGDIYIMALNITGAWAESQRAGGLHFSAQGTQNPPAKWWKFGSTDLKVVKGHTAEGAQYLNVLVKNLAKANMRVGGLLGEDDHTIAATPNPLCRRRLVLASLTARERTRPAASVAQASW